jgi:LuxR family transcriptional regulator, maltose regulon positive regulatory protein
MCRILARFSLEEQNYELASHWALKILAANNCDEGAYRLLMSVYVLEGKRHEALRLYSRCQQVLRDELNVSPMPETETLYQSILRGDPIEKFPLN